MTEQSKTPGSGAAPADADSTSADAAPASAEADTTLTSAEAEAAEAEPEPAEAAKKPEPAPIAKTAPPPNPYADPPVITVRPTVSVLPWWRAPENPAEQQVVWIGVVAGLAAAALVPDDIGLGWFVAGLVGVGGVLTYIRRPSISQSLWLAAALLLLGVGAIRNAEWLFPLCVMGSILCGSLAMTGGRSVLSLAFGAIAVPLAGLRSLPWVARTATKLRPRSSRAIASIGVSIALLIIFGSLFANADATFNRIVQNLVPDLNVDEFVRYSFLFLVAGFGATGACYLVAAPAEIRENGRRPGTLRLKDYALPVSVLLVLFAGFIATQVAVLFGGNDYVMRTAGVTFAEYARSGFWQLLWVTLLTLAVIGVVARWAVKDTEKDQWYLRGLLGGLTLLTLVIVASALSRMWFYQQAYGFTVLRLLVGACELWLGLVYLMVLVAGARLEAAWLPKAILGTGTAFFLALAALNPEGLVAEHNVTRWKETGKIDTYYLSTLSSDAIPALDKLPDGLRACALDRAYYTTFPSTYTRGWRAWNLSRARAKAILEERPVNMTLCAHPHFP